MPQPTHNAVDFGAQALLALRRFPDRVAFQSETNRFSYSATLDLIGKFQAVLAARRAEEWRHHRDPHR